MKDYIQKKSFKIELLTEMLGTVTKDPEVYKTYIESKKPESLNGEEEYLNVEKIEEKGWTGFHKDENGIFIYSYMVKGMLKNAGNVLKEIIKIKALRSKIDEYVFINPRKLYVGKDTPDGVMERPLRAMTMQGPRVSLARSDYLSAGTIIEFEIKLLAHKEISWGTIDTLLAHGEEMGLGQWRNSGQGQFKVVSAL